MYNVRMLSADTAEAHNKISAVAVRVLLAIIYKATARAAVFALCAMLVLAVTAQSDTLSVDTQKEGDSSKQVEESNVRPGGQKIGEYSTSWDYGTWMLVKTDLSALGGNIRYVASLRTVSSADALPFSHKNAELAISFGCDKGGEMSPSIQAFNTKFDIRASFDGDGETEIRYRFDGSEVKTDKWHQSVQGRVLSASPETASAWMEKFARHLSLQVELPLIKGVKALFDFDLASAGVAIAELQKECS